MTAYYNEFDKYAAQWLRNLISAGLIAPGDVDERDIRDIKPDELVGYTQCHFFAGIGGWSLALRLAGWPDDRPVWTGSCPCQPFSAAGRGNGFADERHLWPHWFHLINQCRPASIFGEQVASKATDPWLDLVSADLEALGYAFGAAALPVASIGAPHIRDRTWWVADSAGQRRDGSKDSAESRRRDGAQVGSNVGGLADADSTGLQPGQRNDSTARHGHSATAAGGRDRHESTGPLHGFWRDADWLLCRDGKWRPVEPGTFPLLDGVSASMERLRAIEMAGWEEVIKYGYDQKADPREVVRMVRDAVLAEEGREKAGVGMRQQLYAPQVLLNFLLCVEAACDGTADSCGLQEAGAEVKHRYLRGVHQHQRSGGASRQRESNGQLSEQPSDALRSLSLILARLASSHWAEARKAHAASGRSGMLKGYGNAIAPPLAAEFIQATGVLA